eukprot:405772-Amorphochlora_amoeboformis.AAC.1
MRGVEWDNVKATEGESSVPPHNDCLLPLTPRVPRRVMVPIGILKKFLSTRSPVIFGYRIKDKVS